MRIGYRRGSRGRRGALIAAALLLFLPAAARGLHGQAMHAAPLGIPHTRMGSGTSWIPDASPIREYGGMAGPWMLMAHGDINLYYDHQGTSRGDDQVGSANWLMLMAMREAAGGML